MSTTGAPGVKPEPLTKNVLLPTSWTLSVGSWADGAFGAGGDFALQVFMMRSRSDASNLRACSEAPRHQAWLSWNEAVQRGPLSTSGLHLNSSRAFLSARAALPA